MLSARAHGLRQWPAAPSAPMVPMLPMHAPRACKKASATGRPQRSKGPGVCRGVLAFGWANGKLSRTPIMAVLAKARPSPPIPSPARFLGGFHGGSSSGASSGQVAAQPEPALSHPQQSRLQRKHFRGGRPFLQPSERGHPAVAAMAHPKPHPFSSRGLAPFSSFPSHGRPGIPASQHPNTTRHNPRRHMARQPRCAVSSSQGPEFPNAA